MVNPRGVIPLTECLARPDDARGRHPLIDHLQAVAQAAGDPHGSPAEQLLFLAGLLHDAGKARRSWQERIRDPSRQGAAGPHAFVGAAIFAGLAFRWLRAMEPEDRSELEPTVLWLCRDIADHHGPLKDLELEPPWLTHWTPSVLSDLDGEGLLALLRATNLPVAVGLWPANTAELTTWIDEARRAWGRAVTRLSGNRRRSLNARSLLRDPTARLITADRFAVAGIEEDTLDEATARTALSRLEETLARRVSGPPGVPTTGYSPEASSQNVRWAVPRERQRIQEAVLQRFRSRPREPIYTLVLPTGSGKTLIAMRVALEACLLTGRRRIIYAGPYLSVVQQTRAQLAETTGLSVLEHHHLAVPRPAPGDELVGDEERELLVLESWQAPVVVVTFNQLFRALFPQRSQHTIRIPALRGSFVIIDEPQIVAEASWALFTEMLAAAARAWDMQVLIMTATMPPWRVQDPIPVDLSVPTHLPSRYTLMVREDPLDAGALADELLATVSKGLPVAAILNTIADAAVVLSRVKERLGSCNPGQDKSPPVLAVHGLMTAAHKALHVRWLRDAIEAGRPVIAVATQALEAGVDLDFGRLYRARPILPSVVQAAGRANRHGWRQGAEVIVFDFLRDDGRDSRPYVYRDAIAREESDRMLAPGRAWDERALDNAVTEYYQRLLARKPGSDVVGPMAEAATGRWSALGGLSPFQEGPPRVPVFVPRDEFVDAETRREVEKWGVTSLRELYELYNRPGWLVSLSHLQRRRFLGLLERFTVPVAFDMARAVADIDAPRAILPLIDTSAYSAENGLGDLVSAREPSADVW